MVEMHSGGKYYIPENRKPERLGRPGFRLLYQPFHENKP
jgi:hypothetical protein